MFERIGPYDLFRFHRAWPFRPLAGRRTPIDQGKERVLNHPRSEQDHKNIVEAGFTLVELLIVIVILGILAGIVVFAVGNLTSNSKQSGCATEAQSFYTAYQAYKAAAKGNAPGLGTDASNSRDQVIADLTNQNYGAGPQTPNGTYAANGPFLQKAPTTRTTGYWDDADSFVASGSLTPSALQTAVNAKATADKQPEWGFVPSTGQTAQSTSAGYVCG